MNTIFYIDPNQRFSYFDLLDQLNNRTSFYEEFYAKNFVDYILNCLCGIITDKKFILVDYMFSNGNSLGKHDINLNIKSVDQLIALIKTSKAEVGIYSSGSEGPPKLIFQTISRLLQSVRFTTDYMHTKWGFTYHPAHSAGLQFMLQVFGNEATLVNLRNLKREHLKLFLLENNLDYISATPTFYRLLSPYDFQLASVKNVTLNGEKSTQKLLEDIKSIFPNAKLRNIYGSTEAGPLMSSDSEVFTIPQRLVGKIKLDDNELHFHQSIMSQSVQGREWYPSGDIVEVVHEDPLAFKFVSRKSRIINVGGHNVNPQLIEEEMMEISGIIDVRVYGRENQITGNIIVADILKDKDINLDEKYIITLLKQSLPAYKVPRIIRFVETIEVGRTGKKLI
jgi:acyl-CoA synthetase (AMP-forming)/AMP-acid ligase II